MIVLVMLFLILKYASSYIQAHMHTTTRILDVMVYQYNIIGLAVLFDLQL